MNELRAEGGSSLIRCPEGEGLNLGIPDACLAAMSCELLGSSSGSPCSGNIPVPPCKGLAEPGAHPEQAPQGLTLNFSMSEPSRTDPAVTPQGPRLCFYNSLHLPGTEGNSSEMSRWPKQLFGCLTTLEIECFQLKCCRDKM